MIILSILIFSCLIDAIVIVIKQIIQDNRWYKHAMQEIENEKMHLQKVGWRKREIEASRDTKVVDEQRTV